MKDINKEAAKFAHRLGKRIRHLDGLAGLRIDQQEDEIMRLREMNEELSEKLDAIKSRSIVQAGNDSPEFKQFWDEAVCVHFESELALAQYAWKAALNAYRKP